jgi:hypothetical protein
LEILNATMSSDPFDLLELDRATATDADVRRAYAARLKTTRPEDDRAGFMALRAAFEQVRNEVRWRDEYADHDQDHGPPDDYVQSTAHLIDTEAVEPPPPAAPEGDAGIAWAPPDAATEAPLLDSEPQPGPAPDEPGAETAETLFEDRIGRAMDRLVDTLTATGRAPKVRAVMAIIDGEDVAGIEEYQSMQWQVRQLVCDRTGYNLEPPELRIPDWLTLEVFDALDQYYGWTRQPVMQSWVRRLNDWMVRVRRELAWLATPKEERKQAELNRLLGKGAPEGIRPVHLSKGQSRWEHEPSGEGKGSQIWLWIGAGILLSQIVRFIGSAGGGG